MSLYSLSCPSIGCYQNFNCDPEFLNKVVAVAFVKKSYAANINKTNATTWQDSLMEAYLFGEAFLIFNTSGEKPKPDTATVAGRGMQTTKALAKTHTVNFSDMQGIVKSNVEFYNDMLASSAKYDFYYFTPNRIWDASGYYVTVIGDPVITAELNTYQTAEVSVQWVSKVNPLPYEFDTDTFLEGLYYVIEPAPAQTQSGTNWSAGCGNETINMTATLNVGAIAGEPDVLWELQQSEGSAPITAINLSLSDGDVDWGAASGDSGVYIFKVIAYNSYGCVFGETEITLTINCP